MRSAPLSELEEEGDSGLLLIDEYEFIKKYETPDGDIECHIDWTEPQSQFLNATCTYPLFVGGYGSGKTTTLTGSAIGDLLNYPGANIGVYAPTYDLLKLTAIPNLLAYLDMLELKYDYNKSWYMIDVENYGALICRSMDNPGRIIAYQTFRAHVDELDTLPMHKATMVWNKIVARNRQKVYRLDEQGNRILRLDWRRRKLQRKTIYRLEKNRVSAYTTPEGYLFCYDRWVTNKKDQYELYRAPTRSNPNLPDDYIKNLEATYPPEYVEAYLDGKFVNMKSGRVYTSYERHQNATNAIPLQNETLHCGFDFNVMYGAVVVYVYREGVLHAVGEVWNSYDTQASINALLQDYPEHPIIAYPDASGKNRRSSDGSAKATDIAALKLAGFKVVVDPSNPMVRERVMCMNAAFCNGAGEIHLRVNVEKCPHLVQTLEQQAWDTTGQPDKESGLDHMGDAGGYPVAKLMPIKSRKAGYGV